MAAMRLFKFALGTCLGLTAAAASQAFAQNTVWRCTGPDGRAQYTNVQRDAQGRNCSVVSKEISVVPGFKAPPASRSSEHYPKVDSETQKSRDEGRRRILEEELAAEEQKLSEARLKLTEQENIRLGDEKNYQRVLDRLQPYKNAVEEHNKNVGALKRELENLK
jgi:hypothetical protein